MSEKKTKNTTSKKKEVKELKFSKEQIIKSNKHTHICDALNAILKDSEKYSLKEVDAKLKEFYEGGKK